MKNETSSLSESNLPKQIDQDIANLLARVPQGYELVIPKKESPYFRRKYRPNK